MIRHFAFVILGFATFDLAAIGHAAARDEKCLAAMQQSVLACTNDCVAKARAAVDPSMKDLIVNRACAKNCLKIQMFHGGSCA